MLSKARMEVFLRVKDFKMERLPSSTCRETIVGPIATLKTTGMEGQISRVKTSGI